MIFLPCKQIPYSLTLALFLFFFPLQISFAADNDTSLICISDVILDENIDPAVDDEELFYNIKYDLNLRISRIMNSSSGIEVLDCKDELIKPDYQVLPVITGFDIKKSEKSGVFAECEIFLYFKDQGNSEEIPPVILKALAGGFNKEEALKNCLENIYSQLEMQIAGFGGRSGTYSIMDIYQNTIIINAGDDKKLKKGDFLNIYDAESSKVKGTIVIEKSDSDFAYGRLLEHKEKPDAGDILKKIKYTGFSTTVYVNYISDSTNSGTAFGIIQEYFKRLYVFYPAAGYEFYNITSSGTPVALHVLYAGLSMARHTGRLTLKSQAAAGAGYSADSAQPGWTYNGGLIKGIAEIRAGNNLFFSFSGGYARWFSGDITKTPDIGGFTAGAGIGIKY